MEFIQHSTQGGFLWFPLQPSNLFIFILLEASEADVKPSKKTSCNVFSVYINQEKCSKILVLELQTWLFIWNITPRWPSNKAWILAVGSSNVSITLYSSLSRKFSTSEGQIATTRTTHLTVVSTYKNMHAFMPAKGLNF